VASAWLGLEQRAAAQMKGVIPPPTVRTAVIPRANVEPVLPQPLPPYFAE